MRFYIANIFSLSWCLQNAGTQNSKGSINLELIYEDLAILTRITNAISLTSAALQDTIDTINVTSEFLKINAGNLTEIMSLDIDKVLPDLKKLNTESKSALQNFHEKDLEKFFPFSAMMTWTIFASIPKLKEMSAEKFLEVAKNLTSHGRACENEVINSTVGFSRAMNNHPMEDSERENMVKNFIKVIPELQDCATSIIKYHEKLFEYEIEKKNIESIWDSKNNLELFRNNSLASPTAIPGYNVVYKLFKSVVKTWTGFVNMADLSKVSEDVDSKWFKNAIAKGKPVDKIKTALKPFNEFASNMNALESVWKSFEETIQEILIPKVNMIKFSKFYHPQNTPSNNMSKYLEIEETYKKLNLVIKSVTGMVTWVDETLKETNPNVKQVLEQLKTTKMDYKNEKYIHTIKTLPNYDSFKQFVGRFESLQVLQAAMITNAMMVNSGNTKLDYGVKDLVEEWDVAGKQDCLKNKKELDVQILITLTTALEYAFKFVKESNYSTIQNVLQTILKVRNQLLSLANFVEQLEKKYDSVESVKTVLQLRNSSSLAHSLGSGMRVIQHMTEVLRLSDNLKRVMEYNDTTTKVIMASDPPMDVLKFFQNRNPSINMLVKEIDSLEKSAEDLKGKDLLRMGSVFETALKVQGIPNVFGFAYSELKKSGYASEANELKELKDLDLNFASHKGDLNAASLSLSNLKDFFDELFDLEVKPTAGVTRIISDPFNTIIGCVVVVILLGIGFILIYGLTKNGKERYKKLYLYYFGKQEDFEKRWRYSLFLDRVDITKNVICDAVREVNSQNLLAAVKSGAYINVYNKFGNTGLHVATKRGHYQLVDILIRHGADRTLLNAENKTPEQMIKVMNTTIKNEEEKEQVDKYKKVEMIYNKYRKKKFGKRVPNTFPTTSFHIYIDDRTEEKVTYKFMVKFESITSHEPLPTTTHCIVKTDENGILESDDFNLLSWIFNGVIIVKESWMTDCLQNQNLISKDIDYLVNTVKYNGVVYDNAILPWSLAMAKGTMPYLYGVQVAVVMKDYPNLFTLAAVVSNLGGFMLNQFPEKDQFNKGSHPYLRTWAQFFCFMMELLI